MLNQDDLKKIREIIREEVENESQSITSELRSELKLTRMGIQDELDRLTNRVKDLEIRVTKNHKEITKKVDEILDVLDKQDMKLLKRVKAVEEQIGLSV